MDLIARSLNTGCAASPAAAMLDRNSRLVVIKPPMPQNERAAVKEMTATHNMTLLFDERDSPVPLR
jgi:hypothetical protein